MVYRGEFDPHGQSLYEWHASGQTYLNSHKFIGYERDWATNLNYVKARAYYHNRGRFMQPDPLGVGAADATNPQSLNRYSYVGNDPVNHVDPSGLRYGLVCNRAWGIEGSYENCFFVDVPEWGGADPRDLGGGGGGQTQQRRQSDCDRFVDTLVKVVDETRNSPVSDAMLGRVMLLRAGGMHNKSLGVSGFQEKYWMGNQGGELYAHILAHAGARLIGSDTVVNYMGLRLPILPQQNLTDRTAWTGNGLSQAAYEHDLNEADMASNGKDMIFAMEKSAEVFGDIAGMQVAKLMRARLLSRR